MARSKLFEQKKDPGFYQSRSQSRVITPLSPYLSGAWFAYQVRSVPLSMPQYRLCATSRRYSHLVGRALNLVSAQFEDEQYRQRNQPTASLLVSWTTWHLVQEKARIGCRCLYLPVVIRRNTA